MKKRYVVISLLAAFLSAKGQYRDAPYVKKKVSSTDVQFMQSYYTQSNNHSAVTGGIGTEDLQVYTSDLTFDWKRDSLHSFQVEAGVDIITSASTDNIDYVMSSASRVDARSHVTIGYNKFFRNGFNGGMNGTYSIESDYTSRNVGFTMGHLSQDQSREWSLNIQTFFDDLLWGRLENGHPQKLIYPVELRNKKWYDGHNRYSYNVEFSLYQTINQRMAFGFYPGVVYQKGILGTPFHRVYFLNGDERVENLPGTRVKVPIGFQLNTFVGARWILKSGYRYYWDDFGIVAHTFTLETPCKISPVWSLIPMLRYYTQSSVDYFRPYKQHEASEKYYTSDYDLSKFKSYKVGFAARYAPFAVKRRTTFREVELRYSLYKRSDGMIANIITLFVNFSKTPKERGPQ